MTTVQRSTPKIVLGPHPRGPFLEGPETFSHLESLSKISNLIITELFYSDILDKNRCSLTQEVSGIYSSLF